jgi:hypothetical protein
MPTISTNNTARKIRIPHTVEITLSHILRLPNLPRSHLALETLHHLLPLVLLQPMPKLRLNSTRTNQVNPQRLQVQRQLSRQTVQTRSKRANNSPVRNRVLGNRASSDSITTQRPGTQMRRQQLPQNHRRKEPHHTRLLDEFHIRVRKLDSSEGIACRENSVVKRVLAIGRSLVEQSCNV